MGFNLTTFLAQILNLFLLVWILKRFLYQPVLAVIEKRRQEIVHNIQEADKKLASATKTQQTLEKLEQDFEQRRQKRLEELDQEIQQHRTHLMEELEADYKHKQEKLQADLDSNWATAQSTIQQMISTEFMALSQRVLSEWLHQTPVDKMMAVFDKKLYALSKMQKKQIQLVLNQQKVIQILTATPLTKSQQIMMRNILEKNFILPPKLRIQYKQDVNAILGLELRIGDFELNWSLHTYLEEMNDRLKQEIASLIIPVQRKADK